MFGINNELTSSRVEFDFVCKALSKELLLFFPFRDNYDNKPLYLLLFYQIK